MGATNSIPEHLGILTRRDEARVTGGAPVDPAARFEQARELARAKGTHVTEYADATTTLECPAPRDLVHTARPFGSFASYRAELLARDKSDV